MTIRNPFRTKETTSPPARLGELMFRTWPERRRQRAQLLELDARLLRDIGIHRADAYHEARKPFWRR